MMHDVVMLLITMAMKKSLNLGLVSGDDSPIDQRPGVLMILILV